MITLYTTKKERSKGERKRRNKYMEKGKRGKEILQLKPRGIKEDNDKEGEGEKPSHTEYLVEASMSPPLISKVIREALDIFLLPPSTLKFSIVGQPNGTLS